MSKFFSFINFIFWSFRSFFNKPICEYNFFINYKKI